MSEHHPRGSTSEYRSRHPLPPSSHRLYELLSLVWISLPQNYLRVPFPTPVTPLFPPVTWVSVSSLGLPFTKLGKNLTTFIYGF